MMVNTSIVNDNYNKIEKLGEGSFGSVWKVTKKDDPEKKVIALKIIYLPNDRAAEEAEKEVDILKRLTPCNPSVVCYYGSKKLKLTEIGKPLMLIEMEYIDGETLTKFSERFRNNRDVDLYKHLVALTIDIAKGMKFLHSNGIIHRDIKPDNIMIEKGTNQPKLIDVGLGCFVQKVCILPPLEEKKEVSVAKGPSFQEVQRRLQEMKAASGVTPVSPKVKEKPPTQFRLDADIEEEYSFSSSGEGPRKSELVKMYDINEQGERIYEECCSGRSGSPYYSSPEVLLESIAYPASDVWSLGATLNYAASGKPIYPAQTMNQLLEKMKYDPVPVKTPNRIFNRLLTLCLHRNPNIRATDQELIDFR